MISLKKGNGINSKIKINLFIIYSLVTPILFQSCNEASNENYYQLEFTQTPKFQEYEVGEISFSLETDTVKLNKGDYRSLRFYVGAFKKINTIEQLHTGENLDTFVPMKDGVNKIPFEVKFSETGAHILDGFIEDKIFLNNYQGSDKTRIISSEVRVIKKVTVTE